MPHFDLTKFPSKGTKLNPHGDAIFSPNKYPGQSGEYYSLLSDDDTIQIDDVLADSNLTSIAEEQLSKNVLWKPDNQYDITSSEQSTLPVLQNVAGRVGLGNLVNFENSVLGRFMGVGPQTPMIQIANSRLILEFTRRVADQLAINLLPTINLGGFIAGKIGLGPEEPLIRPAREFIITKLPYGERDMGYYVSLFTGFESNKNPLEDLYGQKSFMSAEELIERTGSGQVSLLKQNITQNIFTPTGIDGFGVGGFITKIIGKISKWLSPKEDIYKSTQVPPYNSYDPQNYAGSDHTIDYQLGNVEFDGLGRSLPPQQTLEEALDFPTEKDVDVLFTDESGWEVDRDGAGNKRGLLKFTQAIVDSGHPVGRRISNLSGGNKKNVNTEPFMGTNGKEHAKGRNLKAGTLNTYCRSWIKPDQYDQYKKLIRSSNHYLKRRGNLGNLNTDSVLNDVGMPRIHPVALDDGVNFKPMMFSIENLAWDSDVTGSLPKCEIGPRGGRIMWFPPYEIEMDENIIASWEKSDFIGRSEPVYTYLNTERTLNFQFKLIMDYPSNLRANVKGSDIDFDNTSADKFFAGCTEPSGTDVPLSQDQITELEVRRAELGKLLEQPPVNIEIEKYSGPGDSESKAINFYFQHSDDKDNQDFDASYTGTSETVVNDNIRNDVLKMGGFLEDSLDGRYYDMILEGHTSKPGSVKFNETLSRTRIDAVKTYISSEIPRMFGDMGKGGFPNGTDEQIKAEVDAKGDDLRVNKDKVSQIESRVVKVWITPNFDSHPDSSDETLDQIEKENALSELDDIEKRLNGQRFMGGECQYFKELAEGDPFVFKTYKEKIDYFHPSFHSQTPDDFSKRLTFLHQCLRQGEPISPEGGGNSVFGRMPVCILRIGDFFNSRMVINNIGFSYDPLLWDLNPEGSGVQPMICSVNVNCNIIGGASLEKPVTQLQNAISSKFYANHQETTKKELEQFRLDKGLDAASGLGPETLESYLARTGG